MPRYRHRRTGSVVNVPEEKAEKFATTFTYELVDEKPKKAPAKKATPSKSSE